MKLCVYVGFSVFTSTFNSLLVQKIVSMPLCHFRFAQLTNKINQKTVCTPLNLRLQLSVHNKFLKKM